MTNAKNALCNASDEVYSILKGITKKKVSKHPFKHLVSFNINDIAQKIHRKSDKVDFLSNSYYWYNLCEEWTDINYLSTEHKDFVKWKNIMKKAFTEIDRLIEKHNIQICEYCHLYNSTWYLHEGFSLEQELAWDSLVPNEDFELLLAAFYCKASIFITRDKYLLQRTSLSLGLNLPSLSFCSPENLEKAIVDDFNQRVYC